MRGGVVVTFWPPSASSGPLPVMVWIPGGGFVVGGASQEDWDPEFFMDQVRIKGSLESWRLCLFSEKILLYF